MEYTATAKYVRISPRKMRLVARAFRMLPAEKALAKLRALQKRASHLLAPVVASALANAKQKNADTATLYLARLEIMGGPTMKRWRSVSRGMAHGYKKRMTHIRVVLSDEITIQESDKSGHINKLDNL